MTRVMVDENQYVEVGRVLAQLDPKDYEVAVAIARANVANSEASAAALRTNVPITSTDTASQLSSAQADVANATAGLAAAERQFEAAVRHAEATATDLKARTCVEVLSLAAKDEILAAIQSGRHSGGDCCPVEVAARQPPLPSRARSAARPPRPSRNWLIRGNRPHQSRSRSRAKRPVQKRARSGRVAAVRTYLNTPHRCACQRNVCERIVHPWRTFRQAQLMTIVRSRARTSVSPLTSRTRI